jgi:hypothetical protein
MNTRIIHCPACGGDKGHAYPVDIDRRDGSLIERWQHCEVCEATGEIEVELEPVELEDLEALCPLD